MIEVIVLYSNVFFWARRRCCRRSLSLSSVYAPTFFSFYFFPSTVPSNSLSLSHASSYSLSLSQKKKRKSESTSIVLSPRWMIFYTRLSSTVYHLFLSLSHPSSSLSLPLSLRSILTLSHTLSLSPKKVSGNDRIQKKTKIVYFMMKIEENRIPYTESYTVAVNRIEDDAPAPGHFQTKKINSTSFCFNLPLLKATKVLLLLKRNPFNFFTKKEERRRRRKKDAKKKEEIRIQEEERRRGDEGNEGGIVVCQGVCG